MLATNVYLCVCSAQPLTELTRSQTALLFPSISLLFPHIHTVMTQVLAHVEIVLCFCINLPFFFFFKGLWEGFMYINCT